MKGWHANHELQITISRESGSIVQFKGSKWCYGLILHFIVTCSYQVLVKIFIQITKKKGYSRLVMNESGRIWNQKQMMRKIKSELLTMGSYPLSYSEVISSNQLKFSHFVSPFVQVVYTAVDLPWLTEDLKIYYSHWRSIVIEWELLFLDKRVLLR